MENGEGDEPSIFKDSTVILLRHARSEANEANLKVFNRNGPQKDYTKNAVDDDLRDCGIHSSGVEECLKAQKVANSLDIHTVFVSPLKRTMETAYQVFKNHPNFEKIRFIVAPKAKEGLKACSDIVGDIEQTMQHFGSLFPNLSGELLKEYEKSMLFFEDLQPDLIAELKDKIKTDEL